MTSKKDKIKKHIIIGGKFNDTHWQMENHRKDSPR